MVDVSSKDPSERIAAAKAIVKLDSQLIQMIQEGGIKKGDVISTAKLAGIMGAKQTCHIIPLCHQINLTSIDIDITFEDQEYAVITCTVKTKDRTGVEMEALTGASISCLALYDMVKSVKKNVVIQDLRLISKTGGKSDIK